MEKWDRNIIHDLLAAAATAIGSSEVREEFNYDPSLLVSSETIVDQMNISLKGMEDNVNGDIGVLIDCYGAYIYLWKNLVKMTDNDSAKQSKYQSFITLDPKIYLKTKNQYNQANTHDSSFTAGTGSLLASSNINEGSTPFASASSSFNRGFGDAYKVDSKIQVIENDLSELKRKIDIVEIKMIIATQILHQKKKSGNNLINIDSIKNAFALESKNYLESYQMFVEYFNDMTNEKLEHEKEALQKEKEALVQILLNEKEKQILLLRQSIKQLYDGEDLISQLKRVALDKLVEVSNMYDYIMQGEIKFINEKQVIEFKTCLIGTNIHQLIIRDCFEPLWNSCFQKISKETTRGVIVSGTPGIGKSFFGLYVMHKLLKRGEVVIYLDLRDDHYLFNGHKLFNRIPVCY